MSYEFEIRRAAMDKLAKREHGQKELCCKLANRFADKEAVEAEVANLKQQGLQSDERFVELVVKSQKERGSGPLKIKAYLQQKSIENELINVYVDESDDTWFSLAKQVAQKKYPLQSLEMKQRIKCARFLSYRGFTPWQINQVLKF